ncbi:MAG: amidohydrolase [Candidatus Omnitrophica bacterium]|nr:amidohydrolase [Candidatus Omnitrophota bacterium]
MTIDAHSHYMPPQVAQNTAFFKQFWSDADGQLRLMDEHHVSQAVLLYPTSDAHINMGGWGNVCAVYNQAISDLVKQYPQRFIGAGIIPVDSPDQISGELNRIEDLGLKVISLASSYNGVYLDDELFFQVYEFARNTNMPIHVHPQIMNPIGEDRVRDPLLSPVLEYVFDMSMCIGKMMMGGVFLKYPEVNFIFAHYGGVLPIVKERFDTTYAMLRQRNFVKDLTKLPGEYLKNMYFDMSGSKSAATLMLALEMTDCSRILWGSDFPANRNFAASLGAASSAILSTEERRLVCGGNFSRLLENNCK